MRNLILYGMSMSEEQRCIILWNEKLERKADEICNKMGLRIICKLRSKKPSRNTEFTKLVDL